jgi:hypothetical protein
MKWRHETEPATENAEHELEDQIRAATGGTAPAPLPGPYWQNLIIRTNRKIDDVASGKGITISWATRVAIPGVVALLSFLIGMHYYAPESAIGKESLVSLVLKLPDHAADSLLALQYAKAENAGGTFTGSLLDVTDTQLVEYCIDRGPTTVLFDSLNESDTGEILALLAVKGD